jgi:hypothetical protein
MNIYRFVDNKKTIGCDTLEIGQHYSCPNYNFIPPKSFDDIGIYELMEGIFAFDGLTRDQVRKFLTTLGYMEIT